MAVNGFSALTSDFVCTARAWTHPVCSIHTVYAYIRTPVSAVSLMRTEMHMSGSSSYSYKV